MKEHTFEMHVTKVTDGWDLRTQDNIWFTIALPDGTTTEVFAATMDLIWLYEQIVERVECEEVYGSGQLIEIVPNDHSATVTIDLVDDVYQSKILFTELESVVKELLREAFSQMDRKSTASERNRELRKHEGTQKIYEEISESDD